MRRNSRDAELTQLRARIDIERRLRRSLDVAESESEALGLITDAITTTLGETPGTLGFRLLVPDPTSLRLGPALSLADDADLIDSSTCVAFRRGITVVSPSTTAFDACAHLRQLPEPASGVCVPLQSGGSVAGVVHWAGPHHRPLDAETVDAIEMLAHLGAARLLGIRSDATVPLRTDPLTGLLNPSSVHQAILALVTGLVPFSLAVCAIDNLDDYQDTHGHDMGDRALRLFAQCLTSTVRPDDVVGRTDLDQFTVVFPSTSALDAAHALERVRETLILALPQAEVPSFTASFGVSDSNQGSSIETIVETADLAAGIARQQGHNRVVVAGDETWRDRDSGQGAEDL